MLRFDVRRNEYAFVTLFAIWISIILCAHMVAILNLFFSR